MTFTSFILQALPVATIVGQILFGITLLMWILNPRGVWMQWVATWSRGSIFAIALIATLGSLFYSEIAGYNPCTFCWYQRIFMYPQIVLLGLAFWIKDQKIYWYSLGLSIIGFLLAFYHYLLQLGVVQSSSCSAVGYSESCSKVFVLQFGYITIPLMAVTAFAMMILVSAFMVYREKYLSKLQ